MTISASAETARSSRRRGESNGSTYWITTFLGANRHTLPTGAPEPGPDEIYPMGFLVEQDASKVVQPHFHQADQFQVVVDGEARLGTHEVRGIAVHFTARYSAYGPIVASDKGVHYFTLRNGWDSGARYMPGARTELRERRTSPHRESVSEPIAIAEAFTQSDPVTVLPLEADGLGAWRYRLAPGQSITGPNPADGRGQNWLVLGGRVSAGVADDLPTFSCLFTYPDDPAVEFVAGPDGADILCMQYPRR